MINVLYSFVIILGVFYVHELCIQYSFQGITFWAVKMLVLPHTQTVSPCYFHAELNCNSIFFILQYISVNKISI